MGSSRQIFIVVAGGNRDAERHFVDTIERRRTISEVRNYLPKEELNNLENIYHGASFIVWGAVPGPMNETRWQKMKPGDVVLIYNDGQIKFAGEIAAKVKNRELAKYFWRETPEGATWELMYFIVNDQRVNVPFGQLNPLFGYRDNYLPRGFSSINEEAAEEFARNYGDIFGVLEKLERGEKLIIIPPKTMETSEETEEQEERIPTEHDEMQWRLIRLGKQAKSDVWVPRNNQNREYDGHCFKDYVLSEFHESLDVPPSIENIDVVWKFGPYSIKSAFEIENSTSVYSGILRLSDVRASIPNSSYPLFIVAPDERRRKVFDELRRPTFSGSCLQLDKVVRFLSYSKLRQLDSDINGSELSLEALDSVAERVN